MIRSELEKGLLEMNLSVPDDSIHLFELLVAELKKWNSKVNLTALSNDADIAAKHIIDSLMFAMCVQPDDVVLDIGSGAGFPAIPLKITKPEIRVVSVDAVGKKIMFQKHVARLLGLDKFEALHSRVENLHASYRNLFDVITSRAFSKLDMFVELAAPMLKSGGRIVAMKGPDVQHEIEGVRDTLHLLGFEVCSVQEYVLPMNKGKRSLVTLGTANSCK